MMLGMFILMSGCSKVDKPKAETLVLKVDDSKIYLDEMLYHVMLAEMQGELYASVVGDDENYWDIKNDDGSTMGEATKKMALDNAIKYELLYNIAMKEGYTLTQEEKELSQSKVDNIFGNIQAEQVQKTELTNDKLLKIQEKIAVATRYYDKYIKTLGVDEAAIKATINIKDYKQYDIQYIFAKKQQYAELTSLQEVANTAEDLTTLKTDSKISSGKLSFLEGENTFGEEINLEDVITSMKVGEVSTVVETVKGYYIIKLIDNASTEKYDSAVKRAAENAITEAFEVDYVAIKKEHKIKIEHKIWDQITMGI